MFKGGLYLIVWFDDDLIVEKKVLNDVDFVF